MSSLGKFFVHFLKTLKLKRPHGPAIRALPANPAASKTPEVLLHAVVTNLKATGAGPAKRLLFPAARTYILLFPAFPFLCPFLDHYYS
jgi:hypothetical protein